MSKRQRFVATSLLLSFGFVFVVYSNFEQSLVPIILLTLATLLLFVWSLKDGLGKDATLLTLVLPMMFTLGVGCVLLARLATACWYAASFKWTRLAADACVLARSRTALL